MVGRDARASCAMGFLGPHDEVTHAHSYFRGEVNSVNSPSTASKVILQIVENGGWPEVRNQSRIVSIFYYPAAEKGLK